MATLTEKDYEQIEMANLLEREFSRILRLTRMREDNVTSYAKHMYDFVFSRLGTSKDNLRQSAVSENISRINSVSDNLLYNNVNDSYEKINDFNEHTQYDGSIKGMDDFVNRVWGYLHKCHPKALPDSSEWVVKLAAEDYYKRRFHLS